MDTKSRLLKDLGFSDDFINVIEKSSFDSNIDNSDSVFPCFDSINVGNSDFTSLIIEKSEEPLNLNAVYSIEK